MQIKFVFLDQLRGSHLKEKWREGWGWGAEGKKEGSTDVPEKTATPPQAVDREGFWSNVKSQSLELDGYIGVVAKAWEMLLRISCFEAIKEEKRNPNT